VKNIHPSYGFSITDLTQVNLGSLQILMPKRPEYYARVKAICERRFGPVPTIYTVAEVCRPELPVEVEGIAFSRYSPE